MIRSSNRTPRLAIASLIATALLLGCGGSDAPDKGTPTAPPNGGGGGNEPTAGGGNAGAPPTDTGGGATAKPEEPAKPDPEALYARGKGVYAANCIACHNPDPAQDGGIGPAVAGSSYELLEARIMRQEYPEGYEPKRPSQLMIAMPYLEPELEALAAYLAPKAGGG